VNLLKREIAPIVDQAWEQIDEEARSVLASHLAARRVVDVDGPRGWELAAINTGEVEPLAVEGEVAWHQRRVQPLVELRVPFTLPIAGLDLAARGATNLDLSPVAAAARAIARDENRALLEGVAAAGIGGIASSSPHSPVVVTAVEDFPRAVVDAAAALRRAGIGGPYAAVLGAAIHDELFAAADDGYPIARRVEQLIDGPIARAPSFEAGVLVSLRGGDYQLTIGRDHSIGYSHRGGDTVELFLTESFAFRVIDPAAAVELRRG
jgi:uncharacterized linocin/CFP29 family protein